MAAPERLTPYLGAFGYNDSPEELGEPGGFWEFENYAALAAAYDRGSALDETFNTLGAPTYTYVIPAIDAQGYVVFHLLVISVQPVYVRQYDLLDKTVAWLISRGQLIEINSLRVAGVQRQWLENLRSSLQKKAPE